MEFCSYFKYLKDPEIIDFSSVVTSWEYYLHFLWAKNIKPWLCWAYFPKNHSFPLKKEIVISLINFGFWSALKVLMAKRLTRKLILTPSFSSRYLEEPSTLTGALIGKRSRLLLSIFVLHCIFAPFFL